MSEDRYTLFDAVGSAIAAVLMIAIASSPGVGGVGETAVFLGAAVLFAAVAARSAMSLWHEQTRQEERS